MKVNETKELAVNLYILMQSVLNKNLNPDEIANTTISFCREILISYPDIAKIIDNMMLDSTTDFDIYMSWEQWKKAEKCEEFNCELVTMLENIPENRPMYKDSGLWQIRTDDMEDVIYQQEYNETFFDFIKRVYDIDNSFMRCFNDDKN